MKCTTQHKTSPLSPSSLKRKPSDCFQGSESSKQQDSNSIMDPPCKKQNTSSEKATNNQHGTPLSWFIEEIIEENVSKFEEDLQNGVALNLFKCVHNMKVSENGIYVQYPGESNVYKTFYGFLSLVDMLRVAGLDSIDDLFSKDYDSSTDHVLLNKIMRLCIASHNARNGFSMIIVFQIIYQLTHFLIAERKAALEYMAKNQDETQENASINFEDIALCKVNRIFVSDYDPKKGELVKIGLTYNQYQKEHSHKVWNSEREAVEIYHLGKILFDIVTWHHIGLDSMGMLIFQKPTKESTVINQVIQKLRVLFTNNGEKRVNLFSKVFTQWDNKKYQEELSNSKSKASNDYIYFNKDLEKTVEWMFAKAQEKYYGECITSSLSGSVLKRKKQITRQHDPYFNSSSIFQFFSSNWSYSQVDSSDKALRSLLFSKPRIQDTLLTIYLKRNPILQNRYIKSILNEMLDKLQGVPSQPLMEGYNYYSLFPNMEFFNKYSYLCRALSSLVFPIPSLRLKLDHWSFVELPQFISSYSGVTNAMEKGKIAFYLSKNSFFNDENSKGTFNTALSQYGVADFDSSVIILKNIVQNHLATLENIIEEKAFLHYSYTRESTDSICYQDLFESHSLRLELLLQELILCYSYMGKGLTEQKDFINAMKFSAHSLKSIIMAWIILSRREKDYDQLPIIMQELKNLDNESLKMDYEQISQVVEESKQVIQKYHQTELNVVPNWFISTLFTVAYIYDHIEKFNEAVDIYSHVVNICPTYSMAFNNRGICKYRISSPSYDLENLEFSEEMSFYDYTLSSALDYANVCPQVNRVCLLNIQSNLTEYDKVETRVEQMVNYYQSIGYDNIGKELEQHLADDNVEMDIYEFWAKDRKERLIADLNFCMLYKPTDTINDISEHLFDRSVNYQSLDMYDQAINDLSWCEELCKIKEKRDQICDENTDAYFGGFPNFKSFQANLYYNRAVCFDAIGKYREAIDDLYQLLEIDGNDTDARMVLEELLEATNIQSRVS